MIDITYSGTLPKVLPGFEHINRYWDAKNNIYAAKIGPGEYYVSTCGEMITTVLGSCISACIRDPEMGIGGMNHFMLPASKLESGRWANTPVNVKTRYGNVAMELLINTIMANGGNRKNLEIKIFGGGSMFDMSNDIGGINISFVKEYLKKEGFEIAAEDLGGIHPRKIIYYPTSGRILLKKILRTHNNTLVNREKEYESRLEKLEKTVPGGTVEFFD